MDWISIISLVVAILALAYSIISNTKKYELTYQYYSDILMWHNEVIEVLSALRINSQDINNKKANLAKLSALIDTGRFYFPNIDKDKYGQRKPEAFRGRRNVILDFLVFEYDIFSSDECERYIEQAIDLQRMFTSQVFKYLDPDKQKKRVRANTKISTKDDLSMEDFLHKNKGTIDELFKYDII